MNRIVQKVSSVWCFLSVFSLFFISVHAEVGPVIPGQSLWCINKSIAGTVDIIESKVCQIDSQLDVIESKIDAIPSDASQLDVIESKIDVIDVTVDIIESKVCEMDSQLDVIESKIDAIPSDASQLDVIESKIDVIDVTVDFIESKVCEMDSQLDVIESKIDALDGCGPRVLTAADIIAGTITLGTPGNYCLSTDLTANIFITADCVTLDLNHRCLIGTVTVSSDDALIQSGNITPAAPTSTPSTAVSITSTSDRARLYDVLIMCTHTATADVGGRSGISIGGNDTQLLSCTIYGGNAGAATTLATNGGQGI